MRLPCAVSAALLLAAAPVAHAVIAAMSSSGMQLGPTDLADDETLLLGLNGTNGWGTFDQLLDHSDPSKGTFKMRYWYGTQYWNGSGSPIILTSPGEQSADGFNKTYTTKERLSGLMAERMGAAVIVLEHRYWGGSSPFDVLTTENMQYLTLDDALKDITYFAKNFNPPFDNTTGSHPSVAPWVFTGGSYSGALAGWLEALEPGTFWAYHGTSGVVQAISDFWTYFSPTMEATPQNCSADLIKVIDHVDQILFNGTSCEKKKLKNMFHLGDLEDGDFGAALLNGVATWQSTQFYSESRDGYVPFFRFCDYIEGVPPKSNSTGNSTAVRLPGPEGVGLEKALQGYADYVIKEMIPDSCESYGLDGFNGTYNTECFKWSNPENPLYKDLSVDNAANRQWTWMLCNEPFEWWQTGAPAGMPSFVSRKVDVEYFRKQCRIMFGDGVYGLATGDSVERLNAVTGGWDHTNTNGRLMYANGQYDPWLDATVSATAGRPGGPLESTSELPVRVIPGGVHCSDLYGQNWAVNAEVKAIAEAEVEQMAGWVQEFYDRKAKRTIEWRG